MGLDMYLDKLPRIPGLTIEQMEEINENLDEYKALIQKNPTTTIPVYEKVKNHIVKRGSADYSWDSLFEEVGYWRKANAIHDWFVKNVQDGVDECDRFEVSKTKVDLLLYVCKKVYDHKDDPAVAHDLLPTKPGFFFGSTDYDEYYYQDVAYTIEVLGKVLEDFDFDLYHLTYRASW